MRAAARSGAALDAGLSRLPVVAAALVRDGRVLAARRLQPVGGWEFPGGKVESDETQQSAVERECLEELGLVVRAVRPLATACDERIELVLWQVSAAGDAALRLRDHDDARWLAVDELDSVQWLPIDRELLPAVAGLLAQPSPTPR